jgi:hypothetical protein
MKISNRGQQGRDDTVNAILKGDVAGWMGYKVMIENIIEHHCDKSGADRILFLPEEIRSKLRLRT